MLSLKTCIYFHLVFRSFSLHPSFITRGKKTYLTLQLPGDIQGLTSSTIFSFASSLASSKERKHQRGTTRQTQRNMSVCFCFTHEQSAFVLDTEVKGSRSPHRENCRQNDTNVGKGKEEGNLIALSSSSLSSLHPSDVASYQG